jgi:hypothetical protein
MSVPWCDCQKLQYEKYGRFNPTQLANLLISGKSGQFIGCRYCYKIDWNQSYIDIAYTTDSDDSETKYQLIPKDCQ